MAFVDELERELHRAAVARERKPRRRWSVPLALAPAAALAALVAAVVISGAITSGLQREEPAREGGLKTVPRLVGGFQTTVRGDRDWSGRWELLVRNGSARLLGMVDGAYLSLVAGKLTFRGDEVTFRVDLAHTRNDPWPEPICAGQRRDTPGTYRLIGRPDGAFELRRVRDTCKGRAAILTAGVWRRAEP